MEFNPSEPFEVIQPTSPRFDPTQEFETIEVESGTVFNPRNNTIAETNLQDAKKVSYMSDTQIAGVEREKYFGMQKVEDTFIQDYVGKESNLFQDVTRGVANEIIQMGQDIKRFGTKVGARSIIATQLGIRKIKGEDVTGEMSEWDRLISQELGELAKTNQKYREGLGIAKTEYDGIAYDLSSVFAQLGMSIVSRSPKIMASIFGITQQQQISEEVFEATGEVGRAELVGVGVAIPTAALEYIGLDRFLKVLKGNNIVKNVLKGIATESIQEGSQAIVEEVGTQVFGGRKKSIEQIVEDIAYQMILGGIAGGGVAGMVSIGQSRMKKEGVDTKLANDIAVPMAKKIEESREIHKETAEIIKRQNDNTTNYGNNVDNGIAEVKKAIGQVETTQQQKSPIQILIEEANGGNVNLGEQELFDILDTYNESIKELDKIKPKSLIQFIKENGGIYDEQGDLQSRELGKQYPFVLGKSPVNKQGVDVTPDAVVLRAWEQNYFPEFTERPSINDLLNTIDDELRGEKTVKGEELENKLQREELENTISQIDQNVDVDKIRTLKGIREGKIKLPGGLTREEILQQIAERQLEEAKQRDIEERRKNLDSEYSKIRKNYNLKQPKTKDKASINVLETYIKPLSTVLKDINPIFAQQIRSSDSDQKIRADKYLKQISPFLSKVRKIRGKDYAEYDLVLKNNDFDRLDELNKKYGITQEFREVRKTLEEIYKTLRETGSDFGYRKNYFPTKVKDYTGYLKYITTRNDWGKIQQHLKEKGLLKAPIEQQSEAIDIYLKGQAFRPTGTITPKGFTKQRKVELVTSELNRFYDDSLVALTNYISNTNKVITVNKFFGVNPENLDEGIGQVVAGLTNEHKLSPGQQQRLSQAFSDYFKSKASSKNVQIYKNINYLTGLTNIGSTLTQLKDLGLSFKSAGVTPSVKAIGQVLTKNQKLKAMDLGITKAMEEIEDIQNLVLRDDTTSDKINKRLNKLLNFSLNSQLFTAMDFFGKNVAVQSHLNKYTNRAVKNGEALQKEVAEAFGEEDAKKIVDDLKNNKITDDVKHFLFYKVADSFPVSKAEMPSAYLRHPGSRIFYTFKTYTIKQLDIINNEVIDKVFSTNPKDIAEGFKNLTLLAFYYASIGIPVDILKDFVFNRIEDKEISDYVFENLLQTVGLSRWNIYNFRRNNADIALIQTIAPPIPIIFDLTRDITGDEYIEDWRTLKNIPIGGKMYYWWFGGGSEL